MCGEHNVHGGRLIVGKKNICPFCKEIVVLKDTFTNPCAHAWLIRRHACSWEKVDVFHLQLLELVRYVVVWFPIITAVIKIIAHYLHLEQT